MNKNAAGTAVPRAVGATGIRQKTSRDDTGAPLVLLVDDVNDGRELLGTYLELKGLRIVHADNGEHGVQLATELHPDAIVMDLHMPTIDGWMATRALKASILTRDIPVLVVTGYPADEAIRAAYEAGASNVLTKTCRADTLHAAIVELLEPRA